MIKAVLTCIAVVAIAFVMFGKQFSPLYPIKELSLCGQRQPNTNSKTCIVDGDTIWLSGVNIRLKGFDTPESRTDICGGFREINLAYAATDRLQALLNANTWNIQGHGIDGTGKRRLATITINGENVGDTLIREGLARSWPDGDEFWCE